MKPTALTSENLNEFTSDATIPLILEGSGLIPPMVANLSDGSIINLAESPLSFSRTDPVQNLPVAFDEDVLTWSIQTFRNTIHRYFNTRDYHIGSHVQITRFSKPRWLMWDSEGEDRLMVYVMYQDVTIRRGDSTPILVKKGSVYAMAEPTIVQMLTFSRVLCPPRCPALHVSSINLDSDSIVLGLPIRGKSGNF